MEILNDKDSPVFFRVPGSVVVGINKTNTAMDGCVDEVGTSKENINQTKNGYFRKNKKTFKESIGK